MRIVPGRGGSTAPLVVTSLLLVCIAAGPTVGQDLPAAAAAPAPVARTHVLVCLQPDVSPVLTEDGNVMFELAPGPGGAARVAPPALARTLEAVGATGVQPLLSAPPADPNRAAALGLDRVHRLLVPDGTDTPALARQLAAVDEVFEYVECDGLGSTAATIPNDPLFGLQYSMLNTGQTVFGTPGVVGADVNATNAWDISTGTSGTLLAVLDAGLDPHIELAGRTITGWNSVDNNTDTSDVCSSHGTHVTGIAAAAGDNGTGIAGLSWQTQIVPVRVLNSCGGVESTLASGLIWAADNGALVINMSLQYFTGTVTLHNAVIYARGQGVILVAAAGNNPIAGVLYPGKWPETITVSATTNQDVVWPNSSTGPEVTVSAPGHNIYSLLDTTSYQYFSGTSMATPHVAGLVTLMLDIDASLAHDEVQDILIATADDLGPPGFDDGFGHGRIDAHAALVEVRRRLGDLDNSGAVDITDLLSLLAQWGPCGAPPAPCLADLDGDGMVGILDLLELLANWT